MRLLDPRFRYVPAAQTDILTTWRRFGFRPTTDSERRERQRFASLDGQIDLTAGRADRKPGLKLAR